MQVTWAILKDVCVSRSLSMQWIDLGDSYELRIYDGYFALECNLSKDQTENVADFESNFKNSGNQSPTSVVTTQYEKNDKDLKLAKACGEVDPLTKQAIVAIQVPGTFGSGAGRYVAGGYAISEDYDRDDYVTVRVQDNDRLIAQTIQAMMGLPTMPTDADIQAMGVIPGIGAFPQYPVVKSYTDDEMPEANRGWYFWANAIGNNTQANGECEVEPIGGYGFLPAGFYIVMTYTRATKTTGGMRANFYWGKLERQ